MSHQAKRDWTAACANMGMFAGPLMLSFAWLRFILVVAGAPTLAAPLVVQVGEQQ